MKSLKWVFSGYLLLQLSLLIGFSYKLNKNLLETLVNWDATHYLHIALHSYTRESLYAFFPLWPMLLHTYAATGLPETYLPLYSTVVSTLLYFAVLWILGTKDWTQAWTRPSIFTMLFFTFCPGSWVFFTPHTESLFLFLSFFSFYYASKNKIKHASLLAGLASLSRNQGVFVILSISFFAFMNENSGRFKARCFSFLKSISLSGFIYAGWLLYLYLKTGNPLTSVHAQEFWARDLPTRAVSLATYFRNALWLSYNNMYGALLFWMGLGIGTRLLFKKSSLEKSFGLYLILSFLIWPVQGNNFPNAYRFSAVLFPFWIIIGNFIHRFIKTKFHRKSTRVILKSLILTIWILISLAKGANYYQGLWCY